MKEIIIAMTVMFVSLVSYLVACKIKSKASFSISNSFYKWFGWKRIWFILSMWGVGIPIIWLVSTGTLDGEGWKYDWGQGLLVAAGISVMIVGVFADYAASKFQEWMHVIPSYLCIGLGLVGVGLMLAAVIPKELDGYIVGSLPLLGFVITSLLLKIDKTPNLIRWVEITGFGQVLIGLTLLNLWIN